MMLATSLAPSPKQPCDAARVTGVDCVVRHTGVSKDIARNAAGIPRFYHQGPPSPRSTWGQVWGSPEDFVTKFPWRVVYLQRAAKYQRPAWRPSQGQKGLDERAIMASQSPSHPW